MNSELNQQQKSLNLAMNEVSFQAWNLRFLALAFLVLSFIAINPWSFAFMIAAISLLSFSFLKQGWAMGITGSIILWCWLFRWLVG